jgi:hypothetical protein
VTTTPRFRLAAIGALAEGSARTLMARDAYTLSQIWANLLFQNHSNSAGSGIAGVSLPRENPNSPRSPFVPVNYVNTAVPAGKGNRFASRWGEAWSTSDGTLELESFGFAMKASNPRPGETLFNVVENCHFLKPFAFGLRYRLHTLGSQKEGVVFNCNRRAIAGLNFVIVLPYRDATWTNQIDGQESAGGRIVIRHVRIMFSPRTDWKWKLVWNALMANKSPDESQRAKLDDWEDYGQFHARPALTLGNGCNN